MMTRGRYSTNNQIRFKNSMLKFFFKTSSPFTDCMTEINNTQKDNAKDLDVVMPMLKLIEHSDNY